MTLARVALTVVAILGVAAPAGAAPSWLAPADLSAAGQSASTPQVAFDAHGNAVAVWRLFDGAHTIVQSAARPAGGAWSAPVALSVAGQNADNPQVAVDPQGNAIAVWRRYNGSYTIVQVAERAAGGAWSTPVDLSADGRDAANAQVAIDAQGNAIAVWERFSGSHHIVQAAERAAGGAWSTPVDLSAAGQDAANAQVAIDPQGNAVALWQRDDGAYFIVQAAARPAGDVWSVPVDLSAAGQHAERPQIAVDPQGDAVALWVRYDGADTIVQAAGRAAGGPWQAPVDLSATGESASAPQVAVDGQGNAVAIWLRSDGTHDIAQAAVRPSGGTWQAPVDLSAAGRDALLPQVAVGGQGIAVAAWYRSNGSHTLVQAAVRAAGVWHAPVDLSAAGQDAFSPQVAFDPQGNAIAIWARLAGANSIVQAAAYDAAGPVLTALSVPASGTAGEPVPLSVSAFDWWSPMGATTWTFGDTRTTTGTAVTHTYASAGTYTVGVTAADAVGHATSATRTITIAPAVTPIPPPTAPPVLAAVTGLRLSPKIVRAATSGPALSAAKVRTGTRVSYTLNVAARVRFTVERAQSGRRAGKRCVEPTARNRGARRCTRYLRMPGGFARDRPAGADRFRFTGRLRGRALRPGRHRLVATPAGGRPARAGFRIVR